jgi:Ca2+-binding RTX toxin-like protein
LDFSNVEEDLYFRVVAKNRIEVVGGSTGHIASAQHVEEVIPGSGRNFFTIEKGARLDDGAIRGDATLSSQSIRLSYTSDAENPNKLFASGFSKPVTVDLNAGTARAPGVEFSILQGNIEFVGGLGPDHITGVTTQANTIRGGKGSDTLIGGDHADVLQGDDGHDILRGGDGDDVLHGGDGDDQLFGDAGNDVLWGD